MAAIVSTRSGKTYVLLPAEENAAAQKITGDRYRRLMVPINPTLHVEAQKAVQQSRLRARVRSEK